MIDYSGCFAAQAAGVMSAMRDCRLETGQVSVIIRISIVVWLQQSISTPVRHRILTCTKLTLEVRERYHPLFHLRKVALFRWAVGKLHFPIAIRIDGISHPVCVDFARNLSWVLSNGQVPESQERANFLRLTESASNNHGKRRGSRFQLFGSPF
jgi:hypothetical protein